MGTKFENFLKYSKISPTVSTCGVYFIIDGSEKMFNKNPVSNVSYFEESIKAYYDIIVQKCLWNSDDLIGLVIFAIDRDNTDLIMDNVWVLHELKIVELEMVNEMQKLIKKGFDVRSVDNYPILDAMRVALNKISSVKKPMIFKKVVLLTCNDNPFHGDEKLRHEIRLKIKTMRDLDLNFEVVGLSKDWNEEHFWKDIRLMFDDYNNTIPKTLSQVKLDTQKPARILREIKLYFTNEVGIKINIHNIVKRMKYLVSYKVDAKTNKEVDSMSTFVNYDGVFDNEDSSDDVSDYILKENVTYKSSDYGRKCAEFTWKERNLIKKIISNFQLSGMRIVGFQDSNFKPELHFSSPYFITWSKNSTKEEKMFFAALLNHCDALNKMGICVARLLVDPKLFSLIPCKEKGGFYMYPIPFSDQMRKFEEWDVYKDAINNDFIDENQILLFKNMIDLNMLNLSDCSFKNPKLNMQLSHIQALALEEEDPAEVRDETEPNVALLRSKIGKPLKTYVCIYPQKPSIVSKSKSTKRSLEVADDKEILEELKEVMKKNKINSCNVEQLRSFATALGVSKSGRKAELISKVIEGFREQI